jgi:hypothetical protein
VVSLITAICIACSQVLCSEPIHVPLCLQGINVVWQTDKQQFWVASIPLLHFPCRWRNVILSGSSTGHMERVYSLTEQEINNICRQCCFQIEYFKTALEKSAFYKTCVTQVFYNCEPECLGHLRFCRWSSKVSVLRVCVGTVQAPGLIRISEEGE